MHSSSFALSTSEQGTPFGGAYLTKYIAPWDQEQLLQWSHDDFSGQARAMFRTSIAITGAPTELSENALLRVLLLHCVNRIQDRYLLTACEALTDLVERQQIEERSPVTLSGPRVTRSTRNFSNPRRVERQPIDLPPE